MENRSTLVDGQVSKHIAGSIRIDQRRLRMVKIYYSILVFEFLQVFFLCNLKYSIRRKRKKVGP